LVLAERRAGAAAEGRPAAIADPAVPAGASRPSRVSA